MIIVLGDHVLEQLNIVHCLNALALNEIELKR